jgi:predicted ATP-grasp superfamily ATP-dependent carboligase
MDKGSLATILEEMNIPHPRTILIQNEDDFEAAFAQNKKKWFLKPRESQVFKKRFGMKALSVSSKEDAILKYKKIARHGLSFVLQEYIPGPASQHYFIDGFVDCHGKIRAVFARQRIRMYPLDFGDSSYITSISPDKVEEAIQIIKKLFAKILYRGIYSAEFKWDERDHRYQLIEINTRPWSYITFTAECGVDVAYMAYLDALEQEVPDVFTYKTGKSSAYYPNEFYAGWNMIHQGELSRKDWFKSLLKAKPMLFSAADPIPAFAFFTEKIRNKLRSSKKSH